MTVLDHFNADYAQTRLDDERRKLVTLYWQSAVMTLHERKIDTTHRIRVDQRGDRTVRWLPYWDRLPDGELFDLLERLQRLRRRRARKGQPM